MESCYRHPHVETGIRCTRCERPICYACMVQAPVGYQCQDCVAGNRPPRVRSVGRTAAPITMTNAIIGVCVGIFILGSVLGMPGLGPDNLGMIPGAIAVEHQWYRLLTAAFLHGGFLHIGFNMYALYYLGNGLEQYLGQRRFLGLYLLSAVGGNAASYYFSDINTWSVGASGAIFGLMAATWVIGNRLNVDTSQIVGLFVINMLIGFASPGIDWRAHLGGAVVGAVAATGATRRGGSSLWFACLVAIVAVVVVRDAQVVALFTQTN